jgi:hypothetical protein
MSDPKPSDKAEADADADARQAKLKKPVEYRRFEKMLKQVLKAPSLRKSAQ